MITVGIGSNGKVFSAPTDIPIGIKSGDEINTNLLVSLETDLLTERKLNDFDGEIEADFYTLKFTKPIYSTEIAKANGYFSIGQIGNAVYKANLSGQNVTYNMDDAIAWGVGINFCIDESSSEGILPFVDIKYRRAESMEYDSVEAGSTSYSGNQLSAANDANYDEWQIALLFGKKIGKFLPYAGVKYSDVRVSAKVQAGSTVYDMNATRGDKILGMVLGCSLSQWQNFNFDIEARLMDEKAVTVRAGYLF
jgi:hypothetical protein